MAKLDNIIQMIRDAQADAIVKNGADFEADTRKNLQASIAAQQSAKKIPSGRPTAPVIPEVKDTRTSRQGSAVDKLWDRAAEPLPKTTLAKQKANKAENEYQNYVKSDEYKRRTAEREKQLSQDRFVRSMLSGIADIQEPTLVSDEKEMQLRAVAERARAEADTAESEDIMQNDLNELAGWSAEDQQILREYVNGQDVDFYNGILGIQNVQNKAALDKVARQEALFQKYGRQRVEELAETYKRQRNAQITEEAARQTQESAGKGFWAGAGHSAASVGAGLLSGPAAVMEYMRELGQRSGRYKTLDPNAIGNLGNVYSGTVRETVKENIKNSDVLSHAAGGMMVGQEYAQTGAFPENAAEMIEQGNGALGEIAAVGYEGLMSAADSLARAVTFGGPGALGMAAVNSFGQTLSDASKQGATPGQAVALATANAAIETMSEKIPLDNLLATAKGGRQAAMEIVKTALIQAGIEATTEEVSYVGELLSEAAILREKSGYNQQIGELVANGASYAEAKAQADKAVWDEAVHTAVVSAASGGMSSAAGSLYANKSAAERPSQGVTPSQSPPGAATAPPPGGAKGGAAQLLQDILPDQQPTQTGATPQGAGVGAPGGILDTALEKAKAGGPVSNSTAEAILSDPASRQALAEQTGKDISGTKAEQRAQVKAAIEQMAREAQANALLQDILPAGQPTSDSQRMLQSVMDGVQESSRQGPPLGLDHSQPEVVESGAPTDYNNLNQNPSIKGTGAAESNFSQKPMYNATLSEDNAQADRRDDVRPIELPQQDINGGNVSAVAGNVYGSRITPDDFASLMEEPTAKGDFTYAKISNDNATQMARETIASAGTWENAYDSWKQSVTVGNAGAEMSARGALFLNHAAQQGNKQLWLETLHYMQNLGTNTAQGLQAFRIIRTLKPVDKIEFVKMSVEKMATEVRRKHGIDLEIDQALIDKFEQAGTDADRDAALEDIQQNVADQIPSTFLDKWTALRYMNMLGNLKTNVRNIAGNVGSAAIYRIKDTIATGMEAIASKVTGGKTERTKSLFVRKSLLNACKEDFQQLKETVSSGGKYGERMSATSQFEQGVQDKRRIFKNSALEAYRKGTNWMMNNEYFGDEAFGRAAYSRALAGYLQANGVTDSDLSKVDSALLDKARAYAVKEAQEVTFHDNSALANIVSKVQKATGVVGQGIMPFTKTPANVLTRAEEFSPLGLINSTVKSIQKARGNENITGADVVNSWAKSITGVGLFALGAVMMDQGLLTGGPDEDEEKAAFDELNGQQNYAIQLPDGTNYTIDWLTPAAMPMFMGAQFWKMFSSDRDLTFADMEQVLTSVADPMIQMSMLQGLNDSLDGIKYSDNNLGQFFINAAVSYLTQGLTNTLLGQIERSTEENRQTTYVDKNSGTPEWLQRQLGKASQKIPGWDYQQMDYRNAWGQTEKNEGGLLYNLLSPGYASMEQNKRITQELNRLRETTGENVFPQAVEKTVTYTDTSGTKHVNRALTQTELDTIQRVEGQTAMRLLIDITANEDYNSLTDAQRAEVISNVYKYAQEQGKKEALAGYYSEAEAWLQNMGDDAANGLIQRAALSTIDSSVTKIVDNIENEWAVSPAAQQELDGLYDSYAGMSRDAQKQILDDATSDTAKYLEIRSKGLDTTQYLDVVGDIKALKPEPNYSDIRDIQTREAIAGNDSLSTREKDIVMRAYMPDYNPTAKKPNTTELKYDEIRKLGVSPEEYTATYRDYLEASGNGKRRRTIAQFMKDYGLDYSTAEKVYDLYAGYWKPWEE